MHAHIARFLAVVCAGLMVCGCLGADDSGAASGEGALVELNGTLLMLPWAKSYQSYCAQGSEYFAIISGNDTFVLADSDMVRPFVGKAVTLRARQVVRVIQCPAGSQCPVPPGWAAGTPEPDFRCVLYRVESISAR